MRAREIPKILFSKIIRKAKCNVYKFTYSEDEAYYVIFSKKAQAAIGYTENKSKKGVFSFLNVWSLELGDNFHVNDFWNTIFKLPDFQIFAGPIPTAQWQSGQGNSLVENIVASYPDYTNGFLIDNPFFSLITSIAKSAYQLVHLKRPKKLSYWEAFLDPTADYSKPP
ncbi:MAG: hypothetical protein A3A98_00475 [Candidatus Staskawiczbacteria bacterium RIFCSPLOWO2_01_FULL_40_39]|uniref:Uncharacterized protein n=1 Tax=Candidatus Staskawiczbacteria bacterium RIFCSPHIGHO2_01_FULL_39_25 TaxID=1802202 RepID=A0A1G2HMJ0_9BACT|nr:MAG: hypothetical protein A2730_00475 [Candidatus Staskawiczbacteria bacterium RIFCSPHIGHO2_01_FULL_39_25]OGZ73211.1 MAG: hypothetical protein A3A98_00475 [Candidatus Staskawiczbacteria bacterium RIFCSPLOWO2_01_FULL_40_39]OGZ75247.1 MAG: hypothetical protein A3I87_00950 [Candidatus Staskawiczbacteria bacterium RIFCSPLOWO2_02_FULL_39_8]